MRLYGVTGWKNAGKTGLMERLVSEITARGYSVSTVKHAHHGFDVDRPGKDSHRHRVAGAQEVVLASSSRVAVMSELRDTTEPGLDDLLRRLAPVDLVLIEGYKRDPHPKIEAYRAETGHPLIAPGDPTIRAIASNKALQSDRPVFDLDDTGAIADFILDGVGLQRRCNQCRFDTFVVVDWSARAAPSPARPCKDAIWIGVARDGQVSCSYHRTRCAAMSALQSLLDAELVAGRRVLAGFDFPFAYPRGFARVVTGRDDPLALWAALAARVEDCADNANNRFAVALALNRLFPGIGPFWGGPEGATGPEMPARGTERRGCGLPEKRDVEARVPRAQSCWKLYTVGSVGSQALLGLPRLQALRARYGASLCVAPFERAVAPIVLVEVFPSLIADVIAQNAEPDEIADRAQVRILAGALSRLSASDLAGMLEQGDPEEGWILGVGREDELRAAARAALAGAEAEPTHSPVPPS